MEANTHHHKRVLSWPAVRRFLLSKRALIVIVVIVILVLALTIYAKNNSNSATRKPSYTTVLPQGKKIDQLGGWKRVSPPGKEPVFAYADTLDKVPISVSQQRLPDSFKGNPRDSLSALAQKFSATDKIDVGDSVAYIGTSSKGPQSVIFVKEDLLILIKSEKKIKDTSWQNYLTALAKPGQSYLESLNF